MGPIVLRQGGTGVPIGGFILAQIAELWALWKENTKLRGKPGTRTGFQDAWNAVLSATHYPFPPEVNQPVCSQVVDVEGPCEPPYAKQGLGDCSVQWPFPISCGGGANRFHYVSLDWQHYAYIAEMWPDGTDTGTTFGFG